MNLHAQVGPTRLRHQIEEVTPGVTGGLRGRGRPYGQTTRYPRLPNGTYDYYHPTVEQVPPDPTSPYRPYFFSTRTRAIPWICPANVTHRRYWTIGTWRAFRGQNEFWAACEHTATMHPVTGQPC